jgi:hypothetical protein
MTVQESKLPFSGYLFWDADPKELDLDKYPYYFVSRVLDCGDLNDWIAIRNYYGMEKKT